ncbi:MAG: restriction endonuclease subunit S [Clostridia bacterium]|nr:restriction endonuclease subunit S [Clostridia bacterium]
MKAMFSDVLQIKNGRNQRQVENPNGKYPIYGSGGIMGYADSYICEANTVIIGRKGSINNPIFVKEPFWNVDTAFGLVANEEILNPKYLYYFCKSFDFDRLNTTVTIPSLTKINLLKVEMPLPSLDEQNEIASVIDKATDLITLRKQQLNKLDLMVKSRFVEMFGDPVANPMGWEVKQLGELCNISRGGSPRPIEQYLGGTVPWIKIGDATTGDDVYLRSTKENIIEAGVKKSRRVKSGSLIFANCGVSLGFARIITFDGCIHDGWLSFEEIDERLNKIFLLKSLNHCTEYFRRLAPEGTQPNLNTGIMKAYSQIIPPLSLQNTFADFVKQVDKSKFEIQEGLKKLELQYNALMQKYFG